ncbi:MAG: bifunctional 3-deoxy-7-phosphoheptulonate synthase/chorismate mutase type II [bacterium]
MAQESKKADNPLCVLNPAFSRPLVIAGPCSAETEEQTLGTARALAAHGIKVFRAGIWKPRTRPNSFEGVGAIGLQWLRKVKQDTGMLIATEVANAKHVYEALKAGVDILWIGARTTVNPFAVQEIADALAGVDIPVLVKNPVSPDLDLWIGALERLQKAGIIRLGAIHRGFTTHETTHFRNSPHWQIAIDLKKRMPAVPVITDPSHISGDRRLVYGVAQEAMDLQLDGLMIEAHIAPGEALSDANQQVTPDELDAILKRLVLRAPDVADKKFHYTLDELRAQVDLLDKDIITKLAKRMDISEEMGRIKKKSNVTILQPSRWDQILHERQALGLSKGLSEEFMTRLLNAIHEESIAHQNLIMNVNQSRDG